MYAHLIAPALNHLLDSASWARQKLMMHAGKRVAIASFPLHFALSLDSQGHVHSANTENPDTLIKIPPLLVARIALGERNAVHAIQISGDTQLAADFGNTLLTLNWDAEADLAWLLGGTAAHQITQAARHLIAWQRSNIANIASTLTEYAHEEARLITKRRHLQEFINSVDTIRDDTARLSKRIEALRSLSPPLPTR